MDLKKFVLEGNPVCRKEAVIVGDHFRITMLTTALIRFEYSEDGGFEDRATQMVCNRDFPVPEFRVSDGGEELHIYTKDLEIHYDRQKFSPSGLMIRVAGGKASERVWHYGDEPKDLLGTARTLDEADGEILLSHGIMSRNGFSVLDDSHTMAMGEDGMVEPRQGNRADFYFFGYGFILVHFIHNYTVRRFYRLTFCQGFALCGVKHHGKMRFFVPWAPGFKALAVWISCVKEVFKVLQKQIPHVHISRLVKGIRQHGGIIVLCGKHGYKNTMERPVNRYWIGGAGISIINAA